MHTPEGHRPLLLCQMLCPRHLEWPLDHGQHIINVRRKNEKWQPGCHQQPGIPSGEASSGALAQPSTPAYLAPKWPLSQRGAAWGGQFGDGGPGGGAVGLEQVGCFFGKLQDVAGVCWLGVDGQDGACAQRQQEERERRAGRPVVWFLPESLLSALPPPSGPLPSPQTPHPGLETTFHGLGVPWRSERPLLLPQCPSHPGLRQGWGLPV